MNQDGTGRLRGFAYGANIGWINFEDTGNPVVNLLTGELSGYAYSANCGWISLKDTNVVVFTDIIRRGLSSSGDGIPDAWKLINFGSLANPNAAANADPDGDGKTNLQEYRDGTNPNNPNSALTITTFQQGRDAGFGHLDQHPALQRLYLYDRDQSRFVAGHAMVGLGSGLHHPERWDHHQPQRELRRVAVFLSRARVPDAAAAAVGGWARDEPMV